MALPTKLESVDGRAKRSADGFVTHRRSTGRRVQVASFELGDGQRATLNELSERMGVSKSEVMRLALQQFAEREALLREDRTA